MKVRITRADLDHTDPAHRLAARAAANALLLLDRIRALEDLDAAAVDRVSGTDRSFVDADDVLAGYEDTEIDDDVDDMTTGAGQAPVPPEKALFGTSSAAPAPVPSRTGEKAAHRRRTADIRAWARENGYPVTGTGRFPRALIEAYEAAHPQEAADE